MISRIDVPVHGGELATFRIGSDRPDAPVVLAIHGITSSSRSWLAVARALGDAAALVAVDLRGRGRGSELPGPYGIDAHVHDMVAVLDQLGIERGVVAGHSLGAYIACALALARPERVSELVLVDGGLTIPVSVDVDPEQFVERFLAAVLARLDMTFPDRAAYRAWWRAHPAFSSADIDADVLDEYADHDLVGRPPELRSCVSPEAIREDGVDLFRISDARSLRTPAVLLCAPRGLLDEPSPMQPLALVRDWARQDRDHRRVVQVPDVNHYTIAIGRRGAEAVAAEILTATARLQAAPAH